MDDNLGINEDCEWIRIDEITGIQKIVIFHRNNNPNYTHYNGTFIFKCFLKTAVPLTSISEYLPAIKENIKAENYKYLFADTKSENLNIIINFSIQNKKNEWN